MSGGAALLFLSGQYLCQTSNSMSAADYFRDVGVKAVVLPAGLATSLDLRKSRFDRTHRL
jgi:hypothetical protein